MKKIHCFKQAIKLCGNRMETWYEKRKEAQNSQFVNWIETAHVFAPGIRRYLIVYDYSSQTANRTLHNCFMQPLLLIYKRYFWPFNCSLFIFMILQCSIVLTQLLEIRVCKTPWKRSNLFNNIPTFVHSNERLFFFGQ